MEELLEMKGTRLKYHVCVFHDDERRDKFIQMCDNADQLCKDINSLMVQSNSLVYMLDTYPFLVKTDFYIHAMNAMDDIKKESKLKSGMLDTLIDEIDEMITKEHEIYLGIS